MSISRPWVISVKSAHDGKYAEQINTWCKYFPKIIYNAFHFELEFDGVLFGFFFFIFTKEHHQVSIRRRRLIFLLCSELARPHLEKCAALGPQVEESYCILTQTGGSSGEGHHNCSGG